MMANLPGSLARALGVAVVYTALSLGANTAAPAHAQGLAKLPREGDMRRLLVHAKPASVSDIAFTDPAGTTYRLADWHGRVVVLNFWATWCPPCRAEMPALEALQAGLGGDDLAVLPVATGRNQLAAIERFYEEAGLTLLPILIDQRSGLARAMGVVGLPVTVILDRNGYEVARLTGEADWNAPEARAVIQAVMASDN